MQNMGIGKLGDSNIVFKSRKFRWTLEGEFPAGKLKPCFVKVSSRPTANLDDTGLSNLLKLKESDPPLTLDLKEGWKPISTTWFELASDDDIGLMKILAAQYEFLECKGDKPPVESVEGTLGLKLYDGCGFLMEEWSLRNVWAASINFGELDYSSSEALTIEVLWRYGGAVYKNHIPNAPDPAYTIYDKTSTGTGTDSLSPRS